MVGLCYNTQNESIHFVADLDRLQEATRLWSPSLHPMGNVEVEMLRSRQPTDYTHQHLNQVRK